jgi:hypothetical protein
LDSDSSQTVDVGLEPSRSDDVLELETLDSAARTGADESGIIGEVAVRDDRILHCVPFGQVV